MTARGENGERECVAHDVQACDSLDIRSISPMLMDNAYDICMVKACHLGSASSAYWPKSPYTDTRSKHDLRRCSVALGRSTSDRSTRYSNVWSATGSSRRPATAATAAARPTARPSPGSRG